MRKVALITGITGQDGSYLAEFLIEKGYEVHGILRRSSSFNTGRIEHLYLDEWVRDMKQSRLVNLHWGDMTDSSSLIRIIGDIHPTEIYNLAAQSHVKVSFDVPEYTAEADAIGTLRLLEAVRICGLEKTCRIYQASTSELFGKVQEVPQKETTPFYPRSPYGVAKQYGFWITKNYRESYNMFAVNGILFNHESERRGETFVTHIADVVLEYLVLDACGSAVVGTGFTQIYIFYNILAKVARVVLIPCIIIRYIVGGSEVYMPVLQFVQHISQDFKQAFAAHSVGDEFAVFVMYGIPVYLFVFQKTILLIDNLP